MPFTPEDAEKHKKDLTSKQKNQWSRVAESVRKRLMKKGVSEKEAAGEAVKQANGVVMNTNESKGEYSVYKNKQVLDYEVKLTVHQEKAHLVIPVVMMVEGVHNGSQGALFHSMDELGKFPASWNGIPVVIYHPEEDGMSVSANDPDIIDKMTVGRVYNTSVDGKRLKAELWLDEDKLNNISVNTLEDINETKEVEVSLGMFTENILEEGEYNGKKYVGIATNHRPDHLAILPDQIGACSCADGCGLGVNKKTIKGISLNEALKAVSEEMLMVVNQAGWVLHEIGNHAEQGYNERMSMIYDKLRSLDSDKIYHYLEEMYDDYLIYSKSGDNNRKMFKQSYQITSGVVEFIGDPVEVHKKVDYIVNSINNKKEEQKMANENCPKCLEKINALIANVQSPFIEVDREWLLTQNEATLDKLAPVVNEVEKVVEKTVEINKLSKEDQADIAWARQQRKEKRDTMIQGIQANTSKELWPNTEFETMTDVQIKRVFDSVVKEESAVAGNYLLNSANNFNANASTEEILLPSGIKFEDKK